MFEDILSSYHSITEEYHEACSGDSVAEGIVGAIEGVQKDITLMAQVCSDYGSRANRRLHERVARANGSDGAPAVGKETDRMSGGAVMEDIGFDSMLEQTTKEFREQLNTVVRKLDAIAGVYSAFDKLVADEAKVSGLSMFTSDCRNVQEKIEEVTAVIHQAEAVRDTMSALIKYTKRMPELPTEELAAKIAKADFSSERAKKDQDSHDTVLKIQKNTDARLESVREKIKEMKAFVQGAARFIKEFEVVKKSAQEILPAGTVASVQGRVELGKSLDRNWADTEKEAFAAALELSGILKPLTALQPLDVNLGKGFPSIIRDGYFEFVSKIRESSIACPRTFAFPPKAPFLFNDVGQIAPLLLNLAYRIPAGRLAITAIDTKSFGEHTREISELQDVPGLFRMINQAEDDREGGSLSCESFAKEISRDMDKMVQERYFTHEAPTWGAYIKRGEGRPLPYRIVAIYSLEGIDTRIALELVRIAQKSVGFGVEFFWAREAFGNTDEQVEGILESYRKSATFEPYPPPNMDSCKTDMELEYFECRSRQDKSPNGPQLASLADNLVRAIKDKPKEKAREFTELFGERKMWSGDATNGFDAVIGWNESRAPVHFLLGDSKNALYYAMLGGATGSGKSNLLHVIIHSLCYSYSPSELQLYLLDFKDGLEFQKYTANGKAWLPQVRCITTHNNPDYALSLFKFLEDISRERKKLYHGLSKYEDYRNAGNKLPRIVVIIDEFHKIFEGANSEKIADALTNILKQGRAYGIHLILATQTLSNLSVLGLPQMLQQIPIRISLKGTGEERILADNNYAASELSVGQGILNNCYGDKKANVKFSLPYIAQSSPQEKVYRDGIRDAAERDRETLACRIFNGTQLPAPPEHPMNGIDKGGEDVMFSLALGLENDFEGSPFVVRFKKNPGENMLITGEFGEIGASSDVMGEMVWKGLVSSCLYSLKAQDIPVVYHNPQLRNKPDGLPDNVEFVSGDADEKTLYGALKSLIDKKAGIHVLMVENYELSRLLIPGRTGGVEPETVLSILNSAFTWEKPLYVILLMHNFAFVSKNMFGYDSDIKVIEGCTKRIGFHLDKETMDAFSPRSSRMKTEESIIYEDVDEPENARAFLPYKAK